MAAFAHFPSSFACDSHQLFAFRRPSLNLDEQLHLRWRIHLCSNRKATVISDSSTRIPRARKKAKSNVDLCNEIREFVSAAGLPEGHVPSMKELLQHGRKDLANIVRRRGYKLLSEILREGNNVKERSSAVKLYGTNVKMNQQDEKVNELAEDVSSTSELSIMGNCFSSANDIPPPNSVIESCESLTTPSLLEKATKFVQDGVLDEVEVADVQPLDDSYVSYGSSSESGSEEGRGCIEVENVVKVEQVDPNKENLEDEGHEATTESNAALKLSGSTLTSKQVLPAARNKSYREDFSSAEGLKNIELYEDLDVEVSDRDNQVEVNRLKVILHQKEFELSQLKEQIEKEKLALSVLQSKAESEIGKAQKLISEKDTEIHAAKESLSGLKEVQIDYWGSGDIVEVAGTFNGWHHRIKMDRHPSSNTINPIRTRKSRLWSTVLWLYPGIYEIKFVVDGHWQIDPEKESVARGTIQNNILRVDR